MAGRRGTGKATKGSRSGVELVSIFRLMWGSWQSGPYKIVIGPVELCSECAERVVGASLPPARIIAPDAAAGDGSTSAKPVLRRRAAKASTPARS